MKRYVIIGNGTAAAGIIEGIRNVDKEGRITVISGEDHHVYSRPLISYYLEGKTDLERMKYRPDDFYETNGCEVLFGKQAESIDKDGKTVKLCDGTVIPYDKLAVATGSRPFVPPMDGLEKVKKKFGFMTLGDALELEKVLTKDANVLIAGAGLIGLKCAEGIYGSVGHITVCDLADRVLSSILDSDCAAIVEKHLESKGVSFILSDTAASFEENRAYMRSGKTVDFDILVLAVGVRANTGLIGSIGGNVNRGIVVNEKMETSIPGIYAAGDCAEGYDSALGSNRVLAILPNAYMQGFTAGKNMAGSEAALTNAIPMNSIGFFGLHMMTAGVYEGEMTEEKSEEGVKRFFVKDGLLKGFMIIGSTERTGILTSLIREKTPLDTVDFGKVRTLVSNMIFTREMRRKKFGGIV